jgi:type IV secretion system protein VirB1
MGAVSSTIAQLIAACSVNTHADTVRAVIQVESRGNPLAINVNGPVRLRKARDQADAAQLARSAMAQGYSVDMGLMQLNSRNLGKVGLTPETAFDACNNIRAGTMILSGAYGRAVARHGEGQPALRASLSAYNTGNMLRGFRNGYVSRYYDGRAYAAIDLAPAGSSPASRAPTVADPFTASSSVFQRKEATNARTRATSP